MANTDEPPIGRRFDHVYLERGDPINDSPQLRERINVLFDRITDAISGRDTRYPIGKIVHGELGIQFRYRGTMGYYYDFGKLFRELDLKLFLASLTIVWRAIPRGRGSEEWVYGIERIFREENTSYRIDEEGGVHYLPDGEFEHNRVATLAVISSARYAATLDAFENIQSDLNGQPPKYKHAIRSAFEANEIVFRLIFDQAQRLTSKEINRRLKPMLSDIFEGDNTALGAATHVADSFGKWVDAAHWYRHGQADEEPNEPLPSLAILMISSGIGFLRWLAEIDSMQDS